MKISKRNLKMKTDTFYEILIGRIENLNELSKSNEFKPICQFLYEL